MMNVIPPEPGQVPIKMWTDGVPVEEHAIAQLKNVASLPFVFKHIAVMPDVHVGQGATIGSVIPTKGAIIPAAVGVDIGCGMLAQKLDLMVEDVSGLLPKLRAAIEGRIPHGRTNDGDPRHDEGAWGPKLRMPDWAQNIWEEDLAEEFAEVCDRASSQKLKNAQAKQHLGTLGTGNHFIEICKDTDGHIWIMLHSGSRGVGNQIGQFYVKTAKELCNKWFIQLKDFNLAYLPTGTQECNDYIKAVHWAQEFAHQNRLIMRRLVYEAISEIIGPVECFTENDCDVHCHHNYISMEKHFGQNVWVTRKGAVSARLNQYGIIPGSMGARSYIVRGLGNRDSFYSCSHGAGRKMSRTEAQNTFTVKDHELATRDVECRKDKEVIDETPGAYKDIDAVIEAEKDLVETVYQLKQLICIKG